MTHSSTRFNELTEYAAERLDATDARELEKHLAECEECKTWLETYRLLAHGLRHPSSPEIAEYAVTPDRVPATDRNRIRRHLDICADCARDAELTQAAATEARQENTRATEVPPAFPPARRFVLGALAASALLVLATGVVFVSRQSPENNSVFVDRRTLHGSTVLEAEREILIVATHIETGADITFRAGNVVALGEGFSIASDASLTIEVKENMPEL